MSTIINQRQFPGYRKYEMELAGRPLTLEVGKLAELANASVMVGYGDTRVLVCVTASARPRDGIDFFPLSVDFEEKLYAVGRIPGSFNRREGRPGEKGILTARVIDRPIRPLFPYDFRNDVSVMATVMSVDHDCSPEIAALIGTSAALAISDIPWNGPVGALKVGLVNGQLVLNPNAEESKVSDLLSAKADIEPNRIVRPIRLFDLLEGEAFHMSKARHRAYNALCSSEKSADIVGRADEGASEMLLLAGELFSSVIRGVVTVKENLRVLENVELVKVSLILNYSLADVGKK